MKSSSSNYRPSLQTAGANGKNIENASSDANIAPAFNANGQTPENSTLYNPAEIQKAIAREKHARQNAYNAFCEQFLEINDFIQQKKSLDEKNTLHAFYRNTVDCNGNKEQYIVLYARPKSENIIVRFFDWVLYGEQEELAQKFLLDFLNTSPAIEQSDFRIDQQAKERSDSLPYNAVPWFNSLKGIGQAPLIKERLSSVKASSTHFRKIAKQIKQQKNIAMEKHNGMRTRIALEDEFFQWKPNYGEPEFDEAHSHLPDLPETLKGLGPQKLEAFSKFVDDIKTLKRTSPECTQAISEFCDIWADCFNRKDKAGDDFRNVINGSSQLRAWNIVAHYIALRDDPYVVSEEKNSAFTSRDLDSEAQHTCPFHPAMMNLRHYGDNTRIMIPPLEEVYLPQETSDEQALVHALKAADKSLRENNEPIEINKQVLTICGKFELSTDSESLTPVQEAEIFAIYQKVISDAVQAGQKIVLTPIFNYTEKTIDRCIDAIVTSILTQQSLVGKLPEIRFFSSDPRIGNKLDLALKDPAKYMASRTANALARVAMPAMPSQELDRLKLQHGISSDDLRDPGMIMMNGSTGKYGAVDQQAALILKGFTEKDVFAKAALKATAISRTRRKAGAADTSTKRRFSNAAKHIEAPVEAMHGKKQQTTTQFIMPTCEMALAPSAFSLSSLLGTETLSDEQSNEIRAIYTRVFDNAKKRGIGNLILIPCFDLEQDNGLREQACAEMLTVLDELLASNPQIVVKMAVASPEALSFFKHQSDQWKKANRQKRAQNS